MSLLNASSALRELDSLERKKAEVLFVLAVLSAKHGYKSIAKGCAEECILLLRRVGAESYEECATSVVNLEGVILPDFLHEDTVRARLMSFGVQV